MTAQPKTQHPRGVGCEDCECWHWHGGSASANHGPMVKASGQCRRNPPQLHREWPETSGIDWCWALVERLGGEGGNPMTAQLIDQQQPSSK